MDNPSNYLLRFDATPAMSVASLTVAHGSTRFSRRFVSASALVSSVLPLSRNKKAGAFVNSRLCIALIGVGGRGRAALLELADKIDAVAIATPDG